MAETIAKTSPRLRARIAGFLYLIVFVAIFALWARSTAIVSGDAAATARNIVSHEFLFRLAFLADLVSAAAYAGVTVLLYGLLKPVSRSVSLLAAVFGLIGSAIMAINMVNHLAPLFILGAAPYLTVFDAEQLQALAYVPLRLQGLGYNIAAVFFAIHLFFLGWLILGATFLPRVLGVLLLLAAPAYLSHSLATFLAPRFADQLYPYILLPGLVAEGSLTLWLTLFGVNEMKWRKQAGAATASAAREEVLS